MCLKKTILFFRHCIFCFIPLFYKVIATNIGGLPNLIIDGFNGLLINPHEQELINALNRVLNSEALRQKLSQNAVTVAQAFDKSVWMDRWKSVICSFIG